jgi:hypothetical protein
VQGGNRMTCKIQNLTHRLVSLRDNSGQTWHLPPGVTLDLMDVEVMDNATIAKLIARGVIAVRPGEMPPEEVRPEASAESVASAPERRRRPGARQAGDA